MAAPSSEKYTDYCKKLAPTNNSQRTKVSPAIIIFMPGKTQQTSNQEISSSRQPRPGIVELLSGNWIDVLNPRPEDIYLSDIAGGLSKICRFHGQTNGFYSVAEHSVLCAVLAEQRALDPVLVRAAFLHDAHEAYIGDIPTPIKALIPGIEEVSRHLDQAVAKQFAIDPDLFYSPDIKEIDHLALSVEAYEFMSLTTPGFKESLRPADQHPVVIEHTELGFSWPLRRPSEQVEALFNRAAKYFSI